MRNPRNPRTISSRYFQICALLLLAICGSYSVSAQTVFGRISGTVKDASGAKPHCRRRA